MDHLLYLMFRCDRECDGKFGNFVGTKHTPTRRREGERGRGFMALASAISFGAIALAPANLPIERELEWLHGVSSFCAGIKIK